MANRACTADNVLGRLMAERDASGLDVPEDVIAELDAGGKSNIVSGSADIKSKVVLENPTEADRVALQPYQKSDSLLKLAGMVIADNKRPSSYFPDLVKNLDESIIDVVVEHNGEMSTAAAKADYRQTVTEIMDGFDTENLSPAQQNYFEGYYRYMTEEGPFYGKSQQPTGLGQMRRNAVSNTLKSSFTVALGNPLETMIKAPALYPQESLTGFLNWSKNGDAFKKIPKLEQLGYYDGIRNPELEGSAFNNLLSGWQGINKTLDIPWKNLAYRIGEAAGGVEGGLKAIDDILFIPRFADMPRQRWGQLGREEVSVLNYSISSARLGVDLINRAVRGDTKAMAGLAIMAGMGTAIGGPGAMIPQFVIDGLNVISPGSGDDVSEMMPKWGASKLIQYGGIGRIGVTISIFNRTIQKAQQNFSSGAEKMADGDAVGGLVDLGLSLFSLASLSSSPLGDAQIQRAGNYIADVIREDMDSEQAMGELNERFNPLVER